MNKSLRLLVLFIILLIPSVILWFCKVEKEWFAIGVALWLGVVGVFQLQISRWFFTPLLNYSIKEVSTKTTNGEPQKWYHLAIKNDGFTPAKNIKVKIKDGENKTWVNLTLPFRDILMQREEDITCMKNLSVGEENYFDIGFAKPNNNFILTVHIEPNNQKIILREGETQTYFLEITADNANPQRFKISIQNEGYEKTDVSHIKILNISQ